MPGELIILDGCSFFFSDDNGDVEASGPTGFFHEDVRHLSRWNLTVDGHPVKPLTSTSVDYFSARVVGQPEEGNGITVRRDRFITDGFHEDIVLSNLTDKKRRVKVELAYGSDFADVMEAQEAGTNGAGRNRLELGKRSVLVAQKRGDRERATAITFNRTPRLTRKSAAFVTELPPKGEWRVCVDVVPIVDGERRPALLRCDSFGDHVPKMELSMEQWLERAPAVEARGTEIEQVYRSSLFDLAALRLRPQSSLKWALPAGGVPWFLTVFGRDSLIASYEAMPYEPTLARTTLEALAELQSKEYDHFRDAEPGKILHELRRGFLARLGEIPHTPYYGSHDSTLWFLVCLDEYERWTGDRAFVREVEESARAAIEWMQGPADLDGDGWLEYLCRSNGKGALANQGWKDSDDAVVFADGSQAEPPIALCEVQGYAYDARLRAARLARKVWKDVELAERLEGEAAELRARFDKAFWIPSRGHYAFALDKDKRQVDALASNVGHLLFSGILEPGRARQTVRRLLQPDMFTGWGIRSLSSDNPAYNPLAYHNGTVWPHDTAIIAEGIRRYGFREEAARVVLALLEAACKFGGQLPEVFAGVQRDGANVPVEYPDALRPQAWAAGAPLLGLRTLLGLDALDGKLTTDPCVPDQIAPLRMYGVSVGERRFDVP